MVIYLKDEEKFIVALVKVLYQQPKIVVIMNMHSLTNTVFNMVRRIVNQYSRKGTSFFFLSNRVDEILSIVEKVATVGKGETSKFISIGRDQK